MVILSLKQDPPPFFYFKTFKFSPRLSFSSMTVIQKSIEINAPINEVFTYFARPEHMADQFPENMGLSVIPVEVKNGFGVGTIFRISGDFDGKKLEWDCETIDYVPMRKIVAKMIEGPFKSWQITVEFEELGEKKSKTSMTAEYDMPMGPLGSLWTRSSSRRLLKGVWKMVYSGSRHCLKALVQYLCILRSMPIGTS